jgi:hypothetical protein
MIYSKHCGYGIGLTGAILATGRAYNITMMDFPETQAVACY